MAKILSSDDHDTVVRKDAELVDKNNPGQYKVFTNLAGSDQVSVAGISPDIVLKHAESGQILTAIEVETDTSISGDSAEERWKTIAEAIPLFKILVRKGTLARAKRICKKLGIKARFQEY